MTYCCNMLSNVIFCYWSLIVREDAFQLPFSTEGMQKNMSHGLDWVISVYSVKLVKLLINNSHQTKKIISWLESEFLGLSTVFSYLHTTAIQLKEIPILVSALLKHKHSWLCWSGCIHRKIGPLTFEYWENSKP